MIEAPSSKSKSRLRRHQQHLPGYPFRGLTRPEWACEKSPLLTRCGRLGGQFPGTALQVMALFGTGVGYCGPTRAAAMTQSHVMQPQYSLEGVALLKDLPPESLQHIQQSCSWRRYEPGEPIVEYLDRSNDVYFLISGEARALVYSLAGKVVSFRDLAPGDTFGEYPAIDGHPRSASVEARSSCLVASMPAAAFLELLQAEPTVARALDKQLVATIRRLSTRVYEFSAAIMAITGRRIYGEMQRIRAKDAYPDEEVKAFLVEKTFPKSVEEMTLKLSNVSAAFYGLMLANVGDRFGWKEADAISKSVFRKLGQLKTKEALELGMDVPRDSRALALVFITAVHSASPEYNFEVFEYLPEETTIRVFGISRYDRIAKKLDIERYLTWPELIPFFEGVAEEMGVRCKIEGDLKELGKEGRYECLYRFTL
jgi:CRP-like cAMP-binding protein